MIGLLFVIHGLAEARPTARDAPPPLEEKMTPALPFAPLQGWLGFAVRPRTERQIPWTPDHPHATVVVLEPTGWDEVAEGTAFYATGAGDSLRLQYSELSRIPYGCDDLPRQMVALTGPHDPPEDLFWVAPASGARPVPVVGTSSVSSGAWTIGPFAFALERTSELAGSAVLREGDRTVWKASWEKPEMDGVERTPADLSDPFGAAAPRPVAAWDLPGGETIVVVRTVGYEGVTFEVLRRDGKTLVSAGKQYIFLCSV